MSYESMDDVNQEIMENSLNKLLHCSICSDIFDQPKDLVCRHTFCKACLDKRLSFVTGCVVIKCPNDCKEQTMLTNEKTTQDLATSHQLQALAETANKKRSYVPTREYTCKGGSGCNGEITVHCSACFLFLCAKCYTEHGEKHEEAVYSCVKVDKKDKLLKGWCNEHAAYADFVCNDEDCHKKIICVYCKHRQHKDHNIESIQTLSAEIKLDILKLHEGHNEIPIVRNKFTLHLRQRKNKCLEMYFKDLCNDEERLLKQFEDLVERSCCDVQRIDNKSPVQLFLQKDSLYAAIDRSIPISVTLSDLDYQDPHPLGNLSSVNKISKYSSFSGTLPRPPDLRRLISQLSCEENNFAETIPNDDDYSYITANTIPAKDNGRRVRNISSTSEIGQYENLPPTPKPRGRADTTTKQPMETPPPSETDSLRDEPMYLTVYDVQTKGDLSPEEIKAALAKVETGKFAYISSLIEQNKVDTMKAILPLCPKIVGMRGGRSRESVIHVAAAYNNLEMLQMLCKNGAKLDAIDSSGCNVLHSAAGNDSYSCMEWILKTNKALINSQNSSGETPLYTTVRMGNDRCLKFLLQNGADRDRKNAQGMTPVDAAKIRCEKAIFNTKKRRKFQRVIEMIKDTKML